MNDYPEISHWIPAHAASPTCHWRQLIVYTQLPDHRYNLFSFPGHPQIEWHRSSNTQKSSLTYGADCLLLVISVLSYVVHALQADQFLPSEVSGLTEHIRKHLTMCPL